jgi:hypothetical protein
MRREMTILAAATGGRLAASAAHAVGYTFTDINVPGSSPTAAAPLADAVPEPSTWATMLIGLAGLGLVGVRSRNSKPRLKF